MAMQVNQVFKNAIKKIGSGNRKLSAGFSRNDSVTVTSPNINSKSQNIHVSCKREYPQAAALPMPNNIDPSELTRFSPQRSRDICGSAIAIHCHQNELHSQIDITSDSRMSSSDPHMASYDCNGAVSLNSVMQSNVPTPFGGMHKFTHLNMPGGQWEQGSRFTAQDLHSSHYTNLRQESRLNWSEYDDDNKKVD